MPDVRTPSPPTALSTAGAWALYVQLVEPAVLMAHPGDRYHALTELAGELAELARVVREERAYAVAALRLPGEGVRALATRLPADESLARQLLKAAEAAEGDSALSGS